MTSNATYQPLLAVPNDTHAAMRMYASKSAFFASMLDLIRRHGGLTQRQLNMVYDELARRHSASV